MIINYGQRIYFKNFSSEIVQRLHVSILFSRKCTGTLGSVLTLRLKMSYVRIPSPPRIFFYFFCPVWRETFPSRHKLTPLTQGTQTRNPWREYKENRSGERKKKHWTSSLWFAFFFFYRMIGPVLYCTVWTGVHNLMCEMGRSRLQWLPSLNKDDKPLWGPLFF